MEIAAYNKNEEFKYIISEYILLLLGLKDNNLETYDKNIWNYNLNDLISLCDDKIIFVPFINCDFGYYLDKPKKNVLYDFKLVNKVLRQLCKVSYNNFMGNTKKQYTYVNIQHCIASYEVAVQNAIVMHLTGKDDDKDDKSNMTMLSLLNSLESWSTKTYEGKKMPFGFILDLERKSQKNVNYLDFLSEEFSATLTDGITSVVVLDSDGNYLDYCTVINDDKFISCQINNCLPLKFAQIINTYIQPGQKRIGIFLLTCGDIMIVKNGKVELLKRNGKWSNFGFSSFIDAMNRYQNTSDIDKDILQCVFSTAIDVSLSHSGGIIAIVNDGNKLYDNIEMNKTILSDSDNILNDLTDIELTEELRKNDEKQNNINKRLLKRNIVKCLLCDNLYYQNINRKLRCELTGLDGATIIQKNGRIVSIGAIIQNEKGSSGGGRGAAAKRLSDYGGLAIKISTDGYIEVYIDKVVKYFIK